MAALRARLAGSPVRVFITVIGILAATIGGAFAIGAVGVPSIVSIDNTFGNVTEESTEIETDLVIDNPNPVGIDARTVRVDYSIAMNDIHMATGTKEGVSIEPGETALPLSTSVDNGAIPEWWISHIRNAERTIVDIRATVTSDRLRRSTDVEYDHEVETDLIGAFSSNETRPVNADHPLVDDPILLVNETRGRWGEVDSTRTPIHMDFVVFNPNLEPYTITGVGYEITMNGIVVGEGTVRETYVIGPGETETVATTTAIRNDRLDEWWVTHLDAETNGHQVSDMRIEFSAHVELPTGETLTIPLDALTYTETIETDIFDEGLHETDDGSNRSEGDEPASTDGDDESSDGSEGKTSTDDGTDGPEEDGNGADSTGNDTDEQAGDGEDSDDGDDDGIGLPIGGLAVVSAGA